jgi:hypothetical protein
VSKLLKDFLEHRGNGLMKIHNHSPLLALSKVYTEYEWLPWKFAAKNYWMDVNNQRKFVDWVGKQLKIKEFEDWYNVKYEVENV